MTDQLIIPSDERKDFHHNHDHNESTTGQLMEMTRRCENLWQTVSGLKMMFWHQIDQDTKDELTKILDNNKPY